MSTFLDYAALHQGYFKTISQVNFGVEYTRNKDAGANQPNSQISYCSLDAAQRNQGLRYVLSTFLDYAALHQGYFETISHVNFGVEYTRNKDAGANQPNSQISYCSLDAAQRNQGLRYVLSTFLDYAALHQGYFETISHVNFGVAYISI